jgi:hypothetical protein
MSLDPYAGRDWRTPGVELKSRETGAWVRLNQNQGTRSVDGDELKKSEAPTYPRLGTDQKARREYRDFT